MKTSVIRHRVADFLKEHAPFDALSEDDLLELAGSGRVKFHQANEYVFRRGDAQPQILWIIQQGRVDLLDENLAGEHLHDVLGEGDLLGLDRFIGTGSSLYFGRTKSDVILYGVSADLFATLIQRYPSLKRFLAAHFSVKGISGFGRTSWLDAEPPSLEFLRARHVALPADASLEDAAAVVMRARSGVVGIVDDHNRPIGMVAVADLCVTKPPSVRIGARPFTVALASPLTTRTAIRQLVKARAEEAAVTNDGTLGGCLQAILTTSELALFCDHNPVRLANAIRKACSAGEINTLLRQARRLILSALAEPGDTDDCCRIGHEFGISAAESCIAQATGTVRALGLPPPDVSFCWVMYGANAHREPIITGFPMIAVIYEASHEGLSVEDRAYFEAVARETRALLGACSLADQAQEWPLSNAPVSEWRRMYSELILDPLSHGLYSRREHFDLLPLLGDASIVLSLQGQMQSQLSENGATIPLLANDTLANLPPLTFFRGLVLELDGAQRADVDIVETVISPITDAARVFALAKGHLTCVDTLERLATAQEEFPDGATIFEDAASAFRIALYYQALVGSSRIAPLKLGKFDQRLLTTAFSSIHRLLEFTASTFISVP